MFTLAHLTDPHIAPLPRVRPWQLLNKRIFGYLNWKAGRNNLHLRQILDQLTADLADQAPHHIAVTGDLANISLPREFAAGQAWLRELGTADQVSVVPGNHDAYVDVAFDRGIGLWRDHMTSAGGALAGDDVAAPAGQLSFPFVRIFGEIALIGLSTAVPTIPFRASGRLGAGQIARLGDRLRALREAGKFRVVLIHHPPLPGLASARRGLEDANELVEVIEREGADLMLYGHNHVQRVDSLETAHGITAIVGGPSASAAFGTSGHLARYNLFEIMRHGNAWHVELVGRGLREPGGKIVELERTELGADRQSTDLNHSDRMTL